MKMKKSSSWVELVYGGTIEEGLPTSKESCPGYNDIAAYLDKNLPIARRKEVEGHMASCRECRTEVLELRRILSSC
ncbi:MAG: zf-HC2 domain-containing protein [Desulfovibrionales bacterium]|nr:zf-HC2 domain-containing protein [Desulfovibrionales bacterium]